MKKPHKNENFEDMEAALVLYEIFEESRKGGEQGIRFMKRDWEIFR